MIGSVGFCGVPSAGNPDCEKQQIRLDNRSSGIFRAAATIPWDRVFAARGRVNPHYLAVGGSISTSMATLFIVLTASIGKCLRRLPR